MAADLAVSLDGGAAFQQVHALDHGVLSKFILNGEGDTLQFALLFFSKLPVFLFLLHRLIIREHVQLLRLILRDFCLCNQIAGRDVYTADQHILMNHMIIYVQDGVHDGMGGAGIARNVPSAMGGLGDFAPIGVQHHRPIVFFAAIALQAFAVVPNIQHNLLRDHMLPNQIQHQQLRHFADNQPPFLKIIRALQYLPGGNTAGGRTILLDIRYRHRLPAPCVVNDQLRVDPKGFIKFIFADWIERGTRYVAQGIKAHRFELFGDASADAPEICQRAMRPELFPKGRLIKRRNAHAVPVGLGLLGLDIHGDLGQKKIGADARCRRNAGIVQNVAHHRHGQLMRRHAVGTQVIRHIDKNLVDGIDDDVLRRNIFQIGSIDSAAVFFIQAHPWRSDNVRNLQRRVFFYGFRIERGSGELILLRFRIALYRPGTDACLQSFLVDLLHTLDHLKQARPAGNAVGFQGRRHGQADRLFRPALVGDDQIGRQWIQMTLYAFHAGVKALGVDGHILPNLFRHAYRSPFFLSISLLLPQLQHTSGQPGWQRMRLSIQRTGGVPGL